MDTLAFTTTSPGTSYKLPKYRLQEGELQATGEYVDIPLVRGSSGRDGSVPSSDGVLIETLLQMIISDLEYKHTLVPAEEGARTLNHLRSALDALNARSYRRQMRGVLGSYTR